MEIGMVGKAENTLLGPILARALQEVDCGAVAEALLIQARKWAPDKVPPEAK
jgi:hypothetical protein